MQVGAFDLPLGIFLGPMAGYTDRSMRMLCREMGAEMTVTEMISAKAVCYGDRKTVALAEIDEDDRPCALQLFGSEPEILAHAASMIESGLGKGRIPDVIDINMGCPMKKIVGNGEGGALLKNPMLIEKLVSAVVGAVKLPVSVKLRSGWDESSLNAVECARAAEAGGASFLTVHARTVRQVYSGTADLRIIAEVKKAVGIPVVGNGDIRSGTDAKRMLSETGCDGIMAARAAVGNPFLFAEIKAALRNEAYMKPTREQRIDTALRHLRLACDYKGERTAVPELRKQLGSYLYALRGAARLRREINFVSAKETLESLLLSVRSEACDTNENNR